MRRALQRDGRCDESRQRVQRRVQYMGHQFETIDQPRTRPIEIRITVHDAHLRGAECRDCGVIGGLLQYRDLPASACDIESAAANDDVIRRSCSHGIPGDRA